MVIGDHFINCRIPGERWEACGYGAFYVNYIAVPSLAVALLVAWWAWRIYKRSPSVQEADPDQAPEDKS